MIIMHVEKESTLVKSILNSRPCNREGFPEKGIHHFITGTCKCIHPILMVYPDKGNFIRVPYSINRSDD